MISFSDYSFYDCEIIEVRDYKPQQLIEFIINYPTGWENNIFENRILKFTGVTRYNVDEIPFIGTSTILDITIESNPINNAAFIKTTMGDRVINFQYAELYKLE